MGIYGGTRIDSALVKLADGKVVSGKVTDYNIYNHVVWVEIHGKVYVTSASNVTLIGHIKRE